MDNGPEQEETPSVSSNQSTIAGENTPSVSSNQEAPLAGEADQRTSRRSWFERQWMSFPASVTLIAFGVGLVIWFICQPKSPGWCIGVLAAAAGIMSLRTEGMHWGEKLAWIFILAFLAVLELKAINRADVDNKNTRDAQNQRFNDIAEGLKESVQASKNQYASTISHVDGVLTTTQTVANLTKRNLEETTGGDSFAYLDFQTPNLAYEEKVGEFPLTGVSVVIERVAPTGTTRNPPGPYINLEQKKKVLGDFAAGKLDSAPPARFYIDAQKALDWPFGGTAQTEKNGTHAYFLIFQSRDRKWYENVRLQLTGPPQPRWLRAINVYEKKGNARVTLYKEESPGFPQDFPIEEPRRPEPLFSDTR
ncbi:MAG TPA: hypothetical protein VFW30_07190 [Bryocella sp.]|nr:hypothetical protein [Bryocella sp.]